MVRPPRGAALPHPFVPRGAWPGIMNMHEQRRRRVSRGSLCRHGAAGNRDPPGAVAPAEGPRGFGTDGQRGSGTSELSGGLRCHGDGARPRSRPSQPLDRRLGCRGNEAGPRWRGTLGGRTRIPGPRRHPGLGNGPDGFQMWVVAAARREGERRGVLGRVDPAGAGGTEARRGGRGGQGRGERGQGREEAPSGFFLSPQPR